MIALPLVTSGCVAVGGRAAGVSGVRVNPLNPARWNWGKGWSGASRRNRETLRTRLAAAAKSAHPMRRVGTGVRTKNGTGGNTVIRIGLVDRGSFQDINNTRLKSALLTGTLGFFYEKHIPVSRPL